MKDLRTGRIDKSTHSQLIELIALGKTASELADIYSVNPETIRKFARKRNLTIVPQDMSLENHPSWAGGTTKDRSGYLLQRVSLDSEYGYLIRAIQKRGKQGTDSHGYAPVHWIVMHNKLGRKLYMNEVVYHLDGDVSNNHPDNLGVYSSNAERLRETLTGKVLNWTLEGFARITGRPKKVLLP
jgi:hypothetical protein